jgi:hypothetical protein
MLAHRMIAPAACIVCSAWPRVRKRYRRSRGACVCGARVCVRGVCVAGVWDRAPLRASNAVVQFLRMRAWTTTASGRMTNECGMARAEAEEQKTGRWHAQRHCGSAKGSETGRAGGLAVSLSLTLSPPRVFDNGAGVCVCLCACMHACAGAAMPRSEVATTTWRRERGRTAKPTHHHDCRDENAGAEAGLNQHHRCENHACRTHTHAGTQARAQSANSSGTHRRRMRRH